MREVALTLVTDGKLLAAAGGDVAAQAAEAAAAGIDSVQLREKGLPDGALGRLVAAVAAALAGSATRLVVNGRPDFAALHGAAVQLPADGLPIAGVRRAFPGLAIGASCHSGDDARRAEDEGADWIVLGPIFGTPGKEDRALGLAVLKDVAAAASIPVHAVGGVQPGNARQVEEAGARGILAIRAFIDQPVAAAAAAFRERGW